MTKIHRFLRKIFRTLRLGLQKIEDFGNYGSASISKTAGHLVGFLQPKSNSAKNSRWANAIAAANLKVKVAFEKSYRWFSRFRSLWLVQFLSGVFSAVALILLTVLVAAWILQRWP